jgi:hypothetical protein
MKYLHIAIVEDFEECLASHTEEGLREQVTDSLAKKSIGPLTDEEWANCVKGEPNDHITIDCLPFGAILYYKIESRLGEMVAAVRV